MLSAFAALGSATLGVIGAVRREQVVICLLAIASNIAVLILWLSVTN